MLTCDNLQKRGKILVNRSIGVKAIRNQWITCRFTITLVRHFGNLLLVARAFLGLLIIQLATIFWLEKAPLIGKRKRRRRWLFYKSFYWSIRREHNRRVFGGDEMSLKQLKRNFVKNLHFCDKGNFCTSAFDVVDHVDSLHIGCI